MDSTRTPINILNEIVDKILIEPKKRNLIERLCEIGGIIDQKVLSTGIQLAETKKVKLIKVENTKNDIPKRRNLTSFTTNAVLNRPQHIPKTSKSVKNDIEFIEVNNYRSEQYYFLYPSIHYCSCDYFQINVIKLQSDWICPHLVAIKISKLRSTSETLICNPDIIDIVRRLNIKCLLK